MLSHGEASGRGRLFQSGLLGVATSPRRSGLQDVEHHVGSRALAGAEQEPKGPVTGVIESNCPGPVLKSKQTKSGGGWQLLGPPPAPGSLCPCSPLQLDLSLCCLVSGRARGPLLVFRLLLALGLLCWDDFLSA